MWFILHSVYRCKACMQTALCVSDLTLNHKSWNQSSYGPLRLSSAAFTPCPVSHICRSSSPLHLLPQAIVLQNPVMLHVSSCTKGYEVGCCPTVGRGNVVREVLELIPHTIQGPSIQTIQRYRKGRGQRTIRIGA